MFKQSTSLPVTFSFSQSQVPVHHMDGAIWRVDHRHLSTPWLFRLATQRDLMMAKEGPARQQQITVSTGLDVDVELIHSVGQFQAFSKKFWLVIEPTSANVAIHFLQADDVWRFGCDHVYNPLKPVSPVASTNPFMNIVAQQSQRMSPIRRLRGSGTQRFSIASAFTEFSQRSIASHQGYLQ